MGELREIIEARTVERLFVLLALLGPILGAALGAILGKRRKALRQGLTVGVAAGALGPVNWLLWRVFNALTDRNGLDTVKNLLLNLALFVGLGVVAGVVIGRVLPRVSGNAPEPESKGGTPE